MQIIETSGNQVTVAQDDRGLIEYLDADGEVSFRDLAAGLDLYRGRYVDDEGMEGAQVPQAVMALASALRAEVEAHNAQAQREAEARREARIATAPARRAVPAGAYAGCYGTEND